MTSSRLMLLVTPIWRPQILLRTSLVTTSCVLSIARFAVDAMKVASQTLIDVEDPSKGYVEIRLGFHTGPLISDVVGSRLPKYSVFGDPVNTTSRLESSSKPGRTQCSNTSAEILMNQSPDFPLDPRGHIKVKGKGMTKTYWINEKALPTWSPLSSVTGKCASLNVCVE